MKSQTIERILEHYLDMRLDRDDCKELADEILDEITSIGYRILPRGSMIKSRDVRPGDRVRIEYSSGYAAEFTTNGVFTEEIGGIIYLLERTDPDADYVFPNRHGAVIRLTPNTYIDRLSERTVASLENGYWSVVGTTATFDENDLRQRYCDFETLSDGINK